MFEFMSNCDNFCYWYLDWQSFVFCQWCMCIICFECQMQVVVGVICLECMNVECKNCMLVQKKVVCCWGFCSGMMMIVVCSGKLVVMYVLFVIMFFIGLVQLIFGIGQEIILQLLFVVLYFYLNFFIFLFELW